MPVEYKILNGKPVPKGSVSASGGPPRATRAQIDAAFHEHAGPRPSRFGAIMVVAATFTALAAIGGYAGYEALKAEPARHNLTYEP